MKITYRQTDGQRKEIDFRLLGYEMIDFPFDPMNPSTYLVPLTLYLILEVKTSRQKTMVLFSSDLFRYKFAINVTVESGNIFTLRKVR